MGQAELHEATGELIIRSVFYFYGEGSSSPLAEQIAADIQMHWNEPEAIIVIHKKNYAVRFEITGIHAPDLQPETVWYNDDPKNNYFRIENYVTGNISFVDGIGSNTGYFKSDNLAQTSTTAAHEYGHTIGLTHPEDMDIRGGHEPGIMYPRGTLTDPEFQYDPHAQAAQPGGTLDPKYRIVTLEDIEHLHLHKLDFDENGFAKLGEFTSIYHEKHEEGFN
ncbi:MAG: peptidase M10 [Chitinophagaceae bacterium]|nr:peptidase M10 [Chitinophagaceae bacterium]